MGIRTGNPKGRPIGAPNKATAEHKATIEELARAHTDTALLVLVEIATKPSATDSARVAAASAILDRGYGKPRQPTELSGPGGGPVQVARHPHELTDEELAAIAAGSGTGAIASPTGKG